MDGVDCLSHPGHVQIDLFQTILSRIQQHNLNGSSRSRVGSNIVDDRFVVRDPCINKDEFDSGVV